MSKTSTKVKIGKRDVELTNLEKVLFPKSNITKKDLIEYYVKISKWMLPHIADRPISMFRYPEGIRKEHFVQKNISDYFPKWIPTVTIRRQEQKSIQMLLCNNVQTLAYIANQACITPHIWLSKKSHLNNPDRLIFDLDPPAKGFDLVFQGAIDLKDLLEKEFAITPFLMTTGSKGVHVVIPIKKELSFDIVRSFARQIAQVLANKCPDYTIEPRKEKRRGKLFLDYMRNAYAQTAVAPYAVRALEKAPVATPIFWKELKKNLDLSLFNMETIFKRVQKTDPWKDLHKKQYSIKKFIKNV